MHMKERKKLHKWQIASAAMAIMLLFGIAVGGTLAFLMTNTNPMVNTFSPEVTTITVDEDFDNSTKSNAAITNNSKVPVYIRVALIPSWEDSDGNPVGESASLDDLEISWGMDGQWIQGTDGFWYYKNKVEAGEATTYLINQATVVTKNEYQMNLQIQAQCIQADGVNEDGESAVVLAWASGVAGVNEDGTLQIKEKEETTE